jgi:hypothetical protein
VKNRAEIAKIAREDGIPHREICGIFFFIHFSLKKRLLSLSKKENSLNSLPSALADGIEKIPTTLPGFSPNK